MVATNAVDMSKWSGDFTAPEAECMVAAGIHTNIVGTGPGGYGQKAEQQAATTIQAGQTLEAYQFVELDQSMGPESWVEAGVQALGPFAPLVARWYVDMEDVKNGIDWSPQQRADYWQRACDRLDVLTAKRTEVYGGRWYWLSRMQGITQFADQGRLLWNSWYDQDPDIDGVPYGGWRRGDVAVEQFAGDVMVCGQSVDRNHIYISPVGRPPAPGTPPDVLDRLDALEHETAAQQRQLDLQNEGVTWRDDLRLVAAGPYAQMKASHVLLDKAGLIPPRAT